MLTNCLISSCLIIDVVFVRCEEKNGVTVLRKVTVIYISSGNVTPFLFVSSFFFCQCRIAQPFVVRLCVILCCHPVHYFHDVKWYRYLDLLVAPCHFTSWVLLLVALRIAVFTIVVCGTRCALLHSILFIIIYYHHIKNVISIW